MPTSPKNSAAANEDLPSVYKNAEDIIRDVGEKIAASFEANRLIVAAVDAEAQAARVIGEWHAPGLLPHSELDPRLLKEGLRALYDHRLLSISDAATHPALEQYRGVFAEMRVNSGIHVHAGSHIFGIYREKKHYWHRDEVELLRDIGSRLSLRLERAAAEEELRRSEEKYRTLFESMDEGFVVVEMVFDKKGRAVDYRFIETNPAFSKLTGLPEDTVGKTARELVPDLEEFWFETYGKVALTGEPVRFEHKSDAMGRWFDVHASRVHSHPSRVAIVFSNATERKEAQERLQKSRDELELRVAERTLELKKANKALKAEVEERNALAQMRAELLQQMVTVQENERKRIARDLHDQLGQQLTALRLKLTAMRAEFEKGKAGPASIERLQEIAEQIDSSVTFIASQLRPIALDELGLQETLRMYVKEWSRRFEVPADFHSNVASKHHLSSEVETHLYRIAQEALNNTIKHSGASEVAVALEQSKKGVVLVIEDNGCGFDPSSPPRRMHGHGFGLAGMAERANLIGAELEIESKRGRGTTVYVRIPPLKKPSASTNGVRA